MAANPSDTKVGLRAVFLGQLERSEAALLGWGLVDGSFSEDELANRASAWLEETGSWDFWEDDFTFLEDLVQHGFLFRWESGDGWRYRTRMGETVRLLAHLRQLFPKHLRQPGDWVNAPTLVADFRFLLRARRYPSRDQEPAEWIPRWTSGDVRLTLLQEAVMRTLLDARNGKSGLPLAGFQVRSITRILNFAPSSNTAGTMICAGTGSGKTIAFYLPALTHLAGMIERDATYWTRALALYPRNELLKDQFTETCRQARRVKSVMQGGHRRPIRIGAYFGPTPSNNQNVAENAWGNPWQARSGGRICPFLMCPERHCSGVMLWRDDDRNNDLERLVCETCGAAVESDEIVLTRRRMAKEPPDILFTTTEMLNQRITDSAHWHLFGIGVPSSRKPAFFLLDEAHTYSGTHGAQVAYLLRRWRHRAQATPHFVGLSATLMDASAFFAQLTGLSQSSVEEVSPEAGEYVDEGMEYLLALRGDPVSGASLLSTTIQTAMLLRRVLDPQPGVPSDGAFGKKVFIFTDDLDVTNRMFFNLLDAEGQDHRGSPDLVRHPDGSLATLRASSRPDEGRRFAFGQSWRLCEDLGHELRSQSQVRLGRVSSQDSGVDAGAEVIVATASLEVGFNDPDVGAVLQHKAPRDAAAFLQRKGRAGRSREMRPWTVVVLSDFGRDRLAYQGYDLLFDPELKPRDLPLGNRHVLKMQAAYACMDWIAHQLAGETRGHFWKDASRPACDVELNWRPNARRRQAVAEQLLERVMEGGDELDRLTEFLGRALRLSSDEVKALLWEAPRALMTSVLPTLHRRLSTQWMQGGCEGAEHHQQYNPLPEFVPSTLFSELNLPEVAIFAVLGVNNEEEIFSMTIARALREFAPGRISRRFGIKHGLSRHWIPVDVSGTAQQIIDIGSFCKPSEREDIGEFFFQDGGKVKKIRVIRPLAIHVRHDAPRDVKDSSNAFLHWHSQLLAPTDPLAGVTIDLPTPSAWTQILEEIRFFTHRQHEPARVRRFTKGSNVSLNLSDGEVQEISTQFVLSEENGQQPVAMGFAFEVDAIRVRVRLPESWRLDGDSQFSEKLPALRVARFRWRVLNEARFDGIANVFERGWLAEISLSALSSTAIEDRLSLADAWQSIRTGRSTLTLLNVLDVIFQSIPSDNGDHEAQVEQRRLVELRESLQDTTTLEILDTLIPVLWESAGPDWELWLRDRFLATLGAAFREAIQQMCPDINAESLLIDLDPGPDEDGLNRTLGNMATIWISEDTPGGGGVIERLHPRLAESPRRFLDLLRGALNESDFESADRELHRLLLWTAQDHHVELIECLFAFRQATTVEAITSTFRTLQTQLRACGLHTSHSVMAALSSRLLRPGSTAQTDELALNVVNRWKSEESRLGVAIEARSLAYALSGAEDLDQSLNVSVLPIGEGQDRRTWRFNAVLSMLWPRGSQARNHALMLRNPHASILAPERLLVVDALESREPEVEFGSATWRSDCDQLLIEHARIALITTIDNLPAFREALIGLLANALDTGSLLLYPRLRGIERSANRISALLELVTPGHIAPPTETEAVMSTARLIVKTASGNRDEVRDLLESLLAVELISPGKEIWLVSPWISDLPLLDNRSGGYAGLEPAWPKRHLTLAELLAFALRTNQQTHLRVVTRPGDHTARFCERLRGLVVIDGNSDRLSIDDHRSELHTKGLVTTAFALNGSMNFTQNGIQVFDETVQLETEPARVAQFLINLQGHYA